MFRSALHNEDHVNNVQLVRMTARLKRREGVYLSSKDPSFPVNYQNDLNFSVLSDGLLKFFFSLLFRRLPVKHQMCLFSHSTMS